MQFENPSLEAMFVVELVMLTLAWIAVSLRVYVRGSMMKAFGLDDTFAVLAVAVFTVSASTAILMAVKASADLPLRELTHLIKLVYIGDFMYLITSIFLKISLAIFYLRFLQERWQHIVIYTGTIVYTLFGTAFVVVISTQCGTVGNNAFAVAVAGKCGHWYIMLPLNITYSTLNAITDWIFVLIPLWAIKDLRIPRQAKISAAFLLGLGAVSSIASLVRFAYLDGLNINKNPFETTEIAIWSHIEQGLGMVAASCATLRPLVTSCKERARTMRGTAERSGRGGSGQLRESDVPNMSLPHISNTDVTSASYGFKDEDSKEAPTFITAKIDEDEHHDGSIV